MDKLRILIAEDEKTQQVIYNKGLSDDSLEKRIIGNGSDLPELHKQIMNYYLSVYPGK